MLQVGDKVLFNGEEVTVKTVYVDGQVDVRKEINPFEHTAFTVMQDQLEFTAEEPVVPVETGEE